MSIQQITDLIRSPQYIRTLFDPVQTHAVYNIPRDDVDKTKQVLASLNATRFRVVKSKSSDVCIICFKVK